MLTRAPLDARLPQLTTALDARHMGRVFGAVLQGAALESCEVDRIKYRPQRSCSVSYRLQLLDGERGRFEQRVSARFCVGGEARRRHARALAAGLRVSPAGPALQHAPELDMLAWWLPNDPKMTGLRWLCDAQALRDEAVPAWLHALRLDGARLTELGSQLVQVVPEQRACARVNARLRAADGTAVSACAYVKCAAANRGALTHVRMQALSDGAAQAAGLLRTPRSTLWHAPTGLHWQEAVAGRPLQQVDPDAAGRAASLGAALAALHRSAVPWGDDAALDPAGLMAVAEAAADMLAAADSRWTPSLQRLIASLGARVSDLARSPIGTLHGDLHPNNILVPDAEPFAVPTLIDLDSLCLGPSALELGGWLADAAYRAALSGQDPADPWPACEAFLDSYALHGGHPVTTEALAWGAAYQLLCRRAYGAVANLKPGRLALVPQLIAGALHVVTSGSVMVLFDNGLSPCEAVMP